MARLHCLHDLPSHYPSLRAVGRSRGLLGHKIVFPDNNGSPARRVGRLALFQPLGLVASPVRLRVLLELEQGIFVGDVGPFELYLVVLRGCHHLLLPELETGLHRRVGACHRQGAPALARKRAICLNKLPVEVAIRATALVDLCGVVRGKLPLLLALRLASLLWALHLLAAPQRPQVLPGIPIVHLHSVRGRPGRIQRDLLAAWMRTNGRSLGAQGVKLDSVNGTLSHVVVKRMGMEDDIHLRLSLSLSLASLEV